MKSFLTSALKSYRQYRSAKRNNKAYRLIRTTVLVIGLAFPVLLSFPQILFAHELSYKNLSVHSREPIDPSIHAVLDKVEERLAVSPIRSDDIKPKVFLTNSFSLYRGLSLYLGGNSFGKGYPLLPTTNIFINRADPSADLVFRNASEQNQRSLSGVIAHEATHLLIRKRVGYWRNLRMPAWKKEGYAEFVAGGSTLSYDEGIKRWKANPQDGTGYLYFKYYMVVKYLLEQKKIGVDELFNRDFDFPSLEKQVLETL